MKNENFTEILKNRIKERKLTQRRFAELVNSTAPQVNNIIQGRERLGAKNTPAWSKVLDIDPLWLMTQGEQGKSPNEPTATPAITSTDDVINVPILSPDARGGFLTNDEADMEQYTIGVMPFNRQIAHTGDVVIPVYGDSMTPKYPAGSYILIRPIEAWREYIELGRSYVLELADWRRLIKIVRKGSDSTHYTLDSYNVDYESNEVAISFINNMWLVVASVNREEL